MRESSSNRKVPADKCGWTRWWLKQWSLVTITVWQGLWEGGVQRRISIFTSQKWETGGCLTIQGTVWETAFPRINESRFHGEFTVCQYLLGMAGKFSDMEHTPRGTQDVGHFTREKRGTELVWRCTPLIPALRRQGRWICASLKPARSTQWVLGQPEIHSETLISKLTNHALE